MKSEKKVVFKTYSQALFLHKITLEFTFLSVFELKQFNSITFVIVVKNGHSNSNCDFLFCFTLKGDEMIGFLRRTQNL